MHLYLGCYYRLHNIWQRYCRQYCIHVYVICLFSQPLSLALLTPIRPDWCGFYYWQSCHCDPRLIFHPPANSPLSSVARRCSKMAAKQKLPVEWRLTSLKSGHTITRRSRYYGSNVRHTVCSSYNRHSNHGIHHCAFSQQP